MLNLYKLELFALVCEAGSFSGAAERLLMTQSGVSQHMQDLEASLGAQLFQRGRRGVTLTPAGQTLYKYAQQMFVLSAAAENAVTNVEQLSSGQVKVGATPGLSVYVLTDWMQSFRVRYPKLTVQLETSTTPQIVKDLHAGRLDIGFVEGEVAPETDRHLGIYPLEEIEQLVVVGQKHPFWRRPAVALPELDGQTMIMRQRNSQTRIWLDQLLQQHVIRFHVGAEFDNIESIKRVVSLGNGLTILPAYAIQAEQEFGLLCGIPIEGKPLVRTLKLVWDKRHFFSPITRSLLVHLQGCFPALVAFSGLYQTQT